MAYKTINEGVRNGLPLPTGAGPMPGCCPTGDTSSDDAIRTTYVAGSNPTPPAKTPTAGRV
jgi:hypothetical protein